MSHINSPYFVSEQTNRQAATLEGGLPLISEGLDSVRTYQFEIHFDLPSRMETDGNISQGDKLKPAADKLTLAAKQVTSLGFSMEPIEVNRVNDKVFYPGKAAGEEVTVTFDNLYQPQVANTLWAWFSSIYDPTNGRFLTSTRSAPNPQTGWKAQNAIVVALDPHGQPLMETRLYGVFPISWKTGEFNYNTNEFHTIEMVLRYDFMEHVTANAGIGETLDSGI